MTDANPIIDVLHVDDEPMLTELVETHLEGETDRIAVRTATSAEEGMEILERDRVDCVVSDYDMPGKNGIEFLEAVRDTDADLPFILYTGEGSEEMASDAISAGVTDYIQKETGTNHYRILANRIINAVDAYRTERERDRKLSAIESAQEGISILDADGHFIHVNQAYADLYGYERDDLLGSHWSMLYPVEDIPIIEEDVLPVVERDGYWHGTTTGVRADGSTFTEDHVLAQTDTGELVCTVRDVSAQRALERDRRETATVLGTLLEALPVGVLAEDEDRRILAVNDRMVDLFELPGDRDAVIGDNCESLAADLSEHFADPEQFVTRINTIVENREPVRREELELSESRYFARSYEPIDLPGGEGHLWMYRDITRDKHREARLEQSAARLSALFDQSPDMINVHDPEGNILDPNPRFLEKTGYDETDLGEMKVWDIDAAISEAEAKTLWTGMEPGDQRRLEGTYQCRDGSTFPVALHLRRVTIEDADRFIVISRDISARKDREEKLNAIQRCTQDLMQTMTATETAELAVETAHEDLDAPLCGVHLLEPTGERLTPAAFVDTVRDSIGIPPEYQRDAADDPPAAVVWEVFRSGEPTYLDDITTDPALAAATPARSAIVQPLGDHGIFIVSSTTPEAFDSADEALIEILTSALTAALDRVQREAAIRESQTRLQAKNDRLEEFTGIVSHDLRNPLNVATGRIELARDESDNAHLEAAERALQRMNDLIEDLLSLARKGPEATETTTLDLDAFIETCWQNVYTKDATLVTNVGTTIQADETQARQLLENLIRNAVEHGGDAVTITVGELDTGFYLEDDGPGIPEAERDTVCNPDSSTAGNGSGFGLNIVRQVAAVHDWSLTITESASGGARFEFRNVTHNREQ